MTGRPAPPREGHRGRVLIVDDDAVLCDIMGAMARDAGFETRATYSGAEFRRAVPGFRPDHIVLDLAIPDEDGLELMRYLAGLRCEARIAVVSSQPELMIGQAVRFGRSRGLNVAGALRKPFRRADFLTLF